MRCNFTGLNPRYRVFSFLALIALMTLSNLSVLAHQDQRITLNVSNKTLKNVFHSIEEQAEIVIMYDMNAIDDNEKVSISVKEAYVEDVLSKLFSGKSFLKWNRKGNVVRVYREAAAKGLGDPVVEPPVSITGKVTDSDGLPLPGATVMIKGTNVGTSTDEKGSFSLTMVPANSVVTITYTGYVAREFKAKGQADVKVVLQRNITEMSAVSVVSTGYQTLPKERATGSFVQLDKELINRSVSTSIIDRLDGVTSGLLFNTSGTRGINKTPSNNALKLNIRGQSTLSNEVSVDPLIVVDNFPFSGDINNINPNDVESITVLKDAAAASIWGARSGNGVIVITTKRGRYNTPLSVELNSSVTIRNKPDLSYDRNFLDASTYIGVEKYLFDKGYFNSDLLNTTAWPPLSPVVEILNKQRNGTLSEADANSQIAALSSRDIRKDYSKYVYQKAINQQYSIGLKGGSESIAYTLSLGLDKNNDNLRRNGYNRVTINSLNTYRPIKNLELTTAINYSTSKTIQNNNLAYGSGAIGGRKYGTFYPYARLADDSGNPASIENTYNTKYIDSISKTGFLDWHYRPLDEINLADNTTKINSVLLRLGAKYNITPYLGVEMQYQNERQIISSRNLQTINAYSTRDLINRFSQINSDGSFTYNFPLGGVLNTSYTEWNMNNIRGQFFFDKVFKYKHAINAIAGTEIREQKTTGYSATSYGYDDEFGTSNNQLNYNIYYNTNPSGSTTLPSINGNTNGTLNRYLSYYANVAYTYDGKYTITASGRKDGSNIFGAKTNNRVIPLWSAGLGWLISKEDFYHSNLVPYLKLRATYGFNGNVYNGSAYITGNYAGSPLNGAPFIIGLSAPNPDLKWEKVKNANLGIDFYTVKNILSGTIEYYIKNGMDLIQIVEGAPSTGFPELTRNSAKTKSRGVDLTISSKNINRNFKWGTTLLFSTLNDKVSDYYLQLGSLNFVNIVGLGNYVVGRPIYSLFAYKWGGLDPETGDPLGYLNKGKSKDYSSIINNINPDSLVYGGNARPEIYGTFRNDFSFKGFSLSVNISYKLGYYFRRSSTGLNYRDILITGGNVDFKNRWRQKGDELTTNIPSVVYPNNNARDQFYRFSEVLIEKGDHVRLKDIRLSYDINSLSSRIKLFKYIQVYAYASNLGIIWRANHYNIDPDVSTDYGSRSLPNPFQIAFGLKVNY